MPRDPFLFPLPKSGTMQFSPDGAWLAVTFAAQLRLLDARTGRVASEILPEWAAYHCAFSPDGRRLAVMNGDLWIGFVSIEEDGAVTDGPQWEPNNMEQFAFSADGEFFVGVGPSHGLSAVNLATDEVEFAFAPKNTWHEGVVWSARRDLWVTAHTPRGKKKTDDGVTELRRWTWPLDTARCETLPYRISGFHRMALSPDGELLAVLFTDEKNADNLQVYSLSRQMILHAQPAATEPSGILNWSGCGRYLAYTTRTCIGVGVLDFQTRQLAAEFVVGKSKDGSVSEWVRDAIFSPDGSQLAIGARRGCMVDFASAKNGPPPPQRPRR